MACEGNPVDTAPRPAKQRHFDLQSTVVHYADGPDRCTVFPPADDDCDRMTTWLSANRSVFEELESMR